RDRGHDLRLVQRGDRDADGAPAELLGSELGRLVRLDVRPQGEAVRARVARDAVEVRVHAVQVDDRSGRFQLVQRSVHAVIRAASGAAVSASMRMRLLRVPGWRRSRTGWEASGAGRV